MRREDLHAAETLDSVAKAIGEWTLALMTERDPSFAARLEGDARRLWRGELKNRLDHLAEAVACRCPELLARNVQWSREAFESRGLPIDDLRASLEAMREYLRPRMADGGEVLLLTPQGTLTDVRAPIRLRPGAAAMAASLPQVEVIAVAIEYAFWLDQRAEVFLRAVRVPPAADDRAPSTADWHRAMQVSMQENAAALAAQVIARDPAAFEVLVGGETSVHPVYDWWLRLWGRDGAIDGEGRSRGRGS